MKIKNYKLHITYFRSFIFFVIVMLHSAATAFAYEPKRIISLAPSITTSLYVLGLEDNIVGVTVYCPPRAKDKEKIGNVLKPNIEKIILLKPDLVIATKDANQKEDVLMIERFGIKTAVIESSDSFSSICKNFLSLAEITGTTAKAKLIISDAEDKIARVQKRTGNTAPLKVFCEVGSKPLFTVSSKSFINEIIQKAGGENIFAGAAIPYPQISREEVIKKDPDVILLLTMGDVTEAEEKYWRKFKSLKAVKNNRIYILDGSTVTLPTPVDFANSVETVSNYLYKREVK